VRKIILTSNLYLPNIGGIENSLKHLAEVGSKDTELTIVSSNIVEGQQNHSCGLQNENGYNIVRYNVPPLKNKYLKAFVHILSAIKTYRKLKDKHTIIVARYHLNVIFAYFSGFKDIRYLVPGVVKNQNNKNNRSNSNRISYFIDCLFQKLAFKVARKTFVFSDSMFAQVKDICPEINIIKVRPGIDSNRFFVGDMNNNETVNLLIVSRLVAAKGISFAIEALNYLPSNYTLTIVGEGPDRNELTKIVDDNKLSTRVFFVGKTSTPEQFYKKCDIFLLPSIYEPFGQTILEASACGLPTVAFDPQIVSTATIEILGDRAFLAGKLDSESYAIAIKHAFMKLRCDDNFRDDIHQFIINKYSWKRLFDEIIYS